MCELYSKRDTLALRKKHIGGTLSPRSGQSCPETDGTAKYKFSIPPRQHC
ncbi:ETNPPL isoform 1 [Pan troglodytes]|uniref:ETNPPL isoform 1 n=2 Tax=Hominidae TaxID=9604 RepID=A0A2J8XQB4_PONAB|nr:ETNPPL isoform 1 [Pan troglodytes]PNJ84209.1 ETNPPL isoform 1 [Pongo abelii]